MGVPRIEIRAGGEADLGAGFSQMFCQSVQLIRNPRLDRAEFVIGHDGDAEIFEGSAFGSGQVEPPAGNERVGAGHDVERDGEIRRRAGHGAERADIAGGDIAHERMAPRMEQIPQLGLWA